ncbi:sulfatase-like hydrolase/transferase [Reichenbachiella sp. MALMAid0571]|uniref:sulfatase-like hydrolase/transferase n=1 Tax=Reichenbachiella sp. MALMAid0571 TaxID=3143939 RepID=UPI0032DEDB9A
MTKVIVSLIIILAGGIQKIEAQSPDRPNILWISVEDISPNLGCYGDSFAKTPVLDKLAKGGVRYTNAIASSPVCAAARSAIITGMYASSQGTQHMRCKGRLPEGFKFYPQVMREAGYFCTNNEKTDYNLPHSPGEIWDELGNDAHWRNRKDKSQPFFSIFNLGITHESSINSKEKHDLKTKDLPKELRADPKKLILPPYFPDTPKVRELWARHYDNIAMMDILVGNILKQLEEDGLAENTIILYFSDHGTGVPRHKRWMYDSGLKVPMIAYAPKKYQHLLTGKPGTATDELISFIDLAPTAIHLTGATIPANMHGRAFLGENLKPERAYAYSTRDRMDERYDMQRSVRSKYFKYIRYYESYKPYTQYMNTPEKGDIMKEIRKAHANGTLPADGAHMMALTKPDEELFDLRNDPDELTNLANDPNYSHILKEMREAHNRWSDNTKDSGLIPETIIRSWESKYDASIYEILRNQNVPISEIRDAAFGKDLNVLTKSLDHENEAVRYWSAISLGNGNNLSENTKAISELNSKLNDKVAAVRIASARALCKTGDFDKTVKLLRKELESDDEWVRLLAAQVLDEIGDNAKPAISELQKRIDTDKNKYVARVANHAVNLMLGTNNEVR